MAKQIADIAEEFGVGVEDIVRKCVAEGVPPDKVRNGMSIVSTGLEAAIRAWLSGPSDEESGFVASKR